MKILFTGGGTGGHFYPIIAVAQAIGEKVKERKIIPPTMFFMAPDKYSPRALFDNELQFVQIPAGKLRRYFSLMNIVDVLKTAYGCIIAVVRMYTIYPDVVFGKGGYASFPALFAARLWRIPVVIHESDSQPGRVNVWAGKFARKVAISYPSAAEYFRADKVALTGNPIRKEIANPLSVGAHEFLGLELASPVVFILGGSQGSEFMNDTIISALPELLNKYQVIHQTGNANIEEIKSTTEVILKDHPFKYRYHPYDYLNELALRMSAGVANVIVTRAGSTIFEIASWGVPSIIIPIPGNVSHDQTSNARSYSRSGAGSVIEQNNLSVHVLIQEIDRICSSPQISSIMRQKAKEFSRNDSAGVIADVILDIALEHE